MTESTEQTTPTNGGGLASLKLAQLQALASQLGIAGGSRMRKADLVTAISDHQRGGSVADRDAAERAASSRDGSTSVADIEPDSSVTSTTDAFSTGTATVACGLATATASVAAAAASSAGGRMRRRRGWRPAAAANTDAAGNRTA